MREDYRSGFATLIGRPNVGKSTLMNRLIGQKIAITSSKAQTTRNRIQTVYTCEEGQIVFLDTPGILWPKFEDQKVGERLACIGSIKDDLLNMEELALILIAYLKERYPGALEKRYEVSEGGEALAVMEEIAKVRGCVKKGDELDYAKTAGIIFDDFRSGKTGRITLEWAEQEV